MLQWSALRVVSGKLQPRAKVPIVHWPRSASYEPCLLRALARITALEARADAEDQLDGPAPAALPSSLQPIKAAAAVGYSESGLRKARDRHVEGPRWWRYLGGRLFVDLDRCPRRPPRT
jgi:hypothetical protein